MFSCAACRTAWFAALLVSLLTVAISQPAGAESSRASGHGTPQTVAASDQAQPTADQPLLGGPQVLLPDFYQGATFTGRVAGLRVRGGAAVALAHQLPDLTDRQREQIREVSGQYEAHRRQWYREHGEQLAQLREQRDAAREAGNTQQADDFEQQRSALVRQAPQASRIVDALEQILTTQQHEQVQARLAAYRTWTRELRRSRNRQSARLIFDIDRDTQARQEVNAD